MRGDTFGLSLPWQIVLVVVTHEEPPAEVIAQNFGLHQLAKRTAEAHWNLHSLRHRFSNFVPRNVGRTRGRHGGRAWMAKDSVWDGYWLHMRWGDVLFIDGDIWSIGMVHACLSPFETAVSTPIFLIIGGCRRIWCKVTRHRNSNWNSWISHENIFSQIIRVKSNLYKFLKNISLTSAISIIFWNISKCKDNNYSWDNF